MIEAIEHGAVERQAAGVRVGPAPREDDAPLEMKFTISQMLVGEASSRRAIKASASSPSARTRKLCWPNSRRGFRRARISREQTNQLSPTSCAASRRRRRVSIFRSISMERRSSAASGSPCDRFRQARPPAIRKSPSALASLGPFGRSPQPARPIRSPSPFPVTEFFAVTVRLADIAGASSANGRYLSARRE